jgi:hypothetical protein
MQRALLLLITGIFAASAAGECTPCDADQCPSSTRVCVDGKCSCQPRFRGPDCSLDRDKMLVFLTPESYDASQIGGLAGADRKCQMAAPAAYRNKVFRAWLTDGTPERLALFNLSDYQYITHGRNLLSRGWPPLEILGSLNGSLAENATSAQFWVGEAGLSCGNWSGSTSGQAVYGVDVAFNESWSRAGAANCTARKSLLCLQQEHYGGPCESSPCRYNSTCFTNFVNSTYACLCPAGTQGANCQININKCSYAPCANNATCIDLLNGYQCECSSGFNGTLCDNDINECALIPSRCNNGTCVNTYGGFHCNCDDGWTGADCRTNIDECASYPCQNGGNCTDGYNGYSCICPEGFSGHTCQNNINECASEPCPLHANCVDLVAGYSCVCGGGYSGPQCQHFTDYCLPQNPCPSGKTCLSGDYLGPAPLVNYSCVCRPYYTGVDCEIMNQCIYEQCQNGGLCTGNDTWYTCDCTQALQIGYSGVNCSECVAPHGSPSCGEMPCTQLSLDTNCGGCGVTCGVNEACLFNSGAGVYACAPDPCANNPCHGGMCSRTPDRDQPFTCDCGELYATGLDCGTCLPPFSDMCGTGVCINLLTTQHCGACNSPCYAPDSCQFTGFGYECVPGPRA